MSRLHEASQPRSDGSESTVGATGAKAEATKLRAALSSISPISDLSSLPRVPCARGSLLMGMATAAGVAGISLVAGRGLRSGLNWGVGSFCFVSLASWETCRRNRKAEQMRMRTVIEGYRNREPRGSLTALAEQGARTDAVGTGTQGAAKTT